jgi:ferritin-like metal-binding protein YciE
MAIAKTKKPAPSKKQTPVKKTNNRTDHESAPKDTAIKPFDVSLEDLFKSDLKDMLWAENHLVAAIPKMIDAAKTPELKKALNSHLKETIQQVTRLKTVFEQLDLPAIPKKCDAMEGLTLSGEHTIDNTYPGTAGRETGIINSGIKVEQFEITSYNGLIKMAGKLGYHDAVEIFKQNLQEEMAASEKLNALNDSSSK